MNTQTITTPDVFKSRVAQRRIDERNMQRFINKIEAALEGAIKKFAVQKQIFQKMIQEIQEL
jgi:phosphoribosyl-dephospho-CoA transferase